MEDKVYADYHVHCEYSDDSVYPMEQVVRDAIEMGMTELCFTDHVDYAIKRDWDDPEGIICEDTEFGPHLLANVDYPRYVAQIQELRQKYGDRFKIKLGLEFGIQSHTIADFEKLFRRYPFDFIILSIHQVGDKQFWTQDFQRGRTQEEYNMCYYEEMLRVVENFKNYSVLGHMDLIVRYDENGVYPFEKVKPLVSRILQRVIADGKGIEINTSNRRYGVKDLTPSRDILRLYRELSGEIITIGSDSHKAEHLGRDIAEAKDELRALGYEYYCTFEQMKPIFHKL